MPWLETHRSGKGLGNFVPRQRRSTVPVLIFAKSGTGCFLTCAMNGLSCKNWDMTAKFSPEIANALHENGNKPLQVVDGDVHRREMDALRKTEDLDAVQEGIRQMEAGEEMSVEEARTQVSNRLAAKYGQ